MSQKHYGRTEIYEDHFDERESGSGVWESGESPREPVFLNDYALPNHQVTSRQTYLAGLDHLNLDLTRLNEMMTSSEADKSYMTHDHQKAN